MSAALTFFRTLGIEDFLRLIRVAIECLIDDNPGRRGLNTRVPRIWRGQQCTTIRKPYLPTERLSMTAPNEGWCYSKSMG